MVEEERAEKQAFLMSEIIEKNYDPDQFMAYCETLKGADIDLWSMSELRTCVRNFQDSLNPAKPEPSPSPVPAAASLIVTSAPTPTGEDLSTAGNPAAEPQAKSSEVEEKKQDLPEPVAIIIKEDKFSLNCRKFDSNSLVSSQVSFEVKDAFLVKGGFFSSDYYLFPIKTLPLEWEVNRRFSDFIWLREILAASFTGVYIPPIPTRKSRQGTIETQLYKKKKIIIKFTSGLARNKLLLLNEAIEKFFNIKDAKEFDDFKKRVKKSVKKPESAEHFYTIDGVAACDVTFPGQRPEKLLDYTSTTEAIEKRLKRFASNVMSDIKVVETEFMAVSELIKQLADLQSSLPNREGLNKLYSGLSECMKDLAGYEDLRKQSFEEFFNIYFKYSYLEKEVMKDMIKERESALSEYTSAETKKKNVDKYRNIYGFLNHRSLNEVERVIQENSMLMNKHFLMFAHEEVCNTTKLHELWTKFIEHMEVI